MPDLFLPHVDTPEILGNEKIDNYRNIQAVAETLPSEVRRDFVIQHIGIVGLSGLRGAEWLIGTEELVTQSPDIDSDEWAVIAQDLEISGGVKTLRYLSGRAAPTEGLAIALSNPRALIDPKTHELEVALQSEEEDRMKLGISYVPVLRLTSWQQAA